MEVIATGREMQAIDAYTIDEIGIPSAVLMERAAMAVVQVLLDYVEEAEWGEHTNTPAALIVTEGGNNGGDGLAIARILAEHGWLVDVYRIGGLKKESKQYCCQKEILQKLQLPLHGQITQEEQQEWKHRRYDVVVDAIFGVGLHREIRSPHREIIEAMNRLEGLKCAVDMPSGIDSTNGYLYGTAFRADITVTFGCRKTGQMIGWGPEYCGDVLVADIGFPKLAFEKNPTACYAYQSSELRGLLPTRRQGGNKGTFGKVLIVAGSETVCGAALLSAEAAYRTGCGLVKLLTHVNNRVAVQERLPEALLQVYENADEAQRLLKESEQWADVVVIGPGIGTEETGQRLVKQALELECPLLVDADAITILAGQEPLRNIRTSEAGLVLTPHMKEMQRISGVGMQELKQNPWKEALAFANANHVICVLKDARTIVAEPGEDACYLNLSGNDGMATGGSGDVLTGVIAALAAQGMPLAQASRSGVFLHGLAGNRAAQMHGAAAMLAGDIISGLESVLRDTYMEGKQEGNYEMV